MKIWPKNGLFLLPLMTALFVVEIGVSMYNKAPAPYKPFAPGINWVCITGERNFDVGEMHTYEHARKYGDNVWCFDHILDVKLVPEKLQDL